MLEWTEYVKIFVALTAIVNPVGAIPMFVSLTAKDTIAEKQRIARIASIAVAVVLVIVALVGKPLLAFFGITLPSFKVAGAILLLLMAIAMMQATPDRQRQTPEEAEEAEDKDSVAVVPLAIPLLSGPGAISTTIIYATERTSLAHLGIIVLCCLLVALTTWSALRVATPVGNWLGRTGVNVAVRVMGLLLAAIAVEIFASGLVVLFPGLG